MLIFFSTCMWCAFLLLTSHLMRNIFRDLQKVLGLCFCVCVFWKMSALIIQKFQTFLHELQQETGARACFYCLFSGHFFESGASC